MAVACFDLDSTLIQTASGKTFYAGRKDWKWTFAGVPARLRKLTDEGAAIVVVSNQLGISKGKTDRREVEGRFADVVQAGGLRNIMAIFIPSETGRKPDPAAWQFVRSEVEKGTAGRCRVDERGSLFVGDAAGRPAAWDGDKKTKKDFSCADRKFAANAGLRFQTPEQYFVGDSREPRFSWGSVDPAQLLKATSALDPVSGVSPRPLVPEDGRLEMVLMVGPPASGKSSLFARVFEPRGYVHVSRDVLQTQPRCRQAAAGALAKGQSVVVDNTSPSRLAREEYIAVAQQYGARVRVLRMMVDEELAHHLNNYRARVSDREKVPNIAFNMYKKYFQEPELDEGIDDILPVTFVPTFSSDVEKQIFLQWTE